MRERRRRTIRYAFAGLWVFFTCSLMVWWIVFGFEQLNRLSQLGYPLGEDLARFQSMLLWEGGTLIISLIGGGLTLAYFMYKELRASDQVRQFFVSFTHDTRTSLASVLLRAELLRDQLTAETPRETLAGLISDIDKLSLQLNNSLAASNVDRLNLHLELIQLSALIDEVAQKFPQLKVSLSGDAEVKADSQAIHGILTNIFNNAASHGKATEISIIVQSKARFSQIAITDNGTGFKGEINKLGHRFYRHYSGSGTGLGLSIAKDLIKKMEGTIQFFPSPQGFSVIINLPKCR